MTWFERFALVAILLFARIVYAILDIREAIQRLVADYGYFIQRMMRHLGL